MQKKRLSLGIVTACLALTGCETLSFDKDRAAEQRKQELCRDIDTRDQPQCSGTSKPVPETD